MEERVRQRVEDGKQSAPHRLLYYSFTKLLSVKCLSAPKYTNITLRSHPLDGVSEAGYMVIECIEETQGIMLSNTWSGKQHDAELHANFFRRLSRNLLSICKTPLPRIGSFIINREGYLTLNNRPLSMELQQLEYEKVTTELSRDYTHSTV